MDTQVTVRLTRTLDRSVTALARRMQLKRSDIVRMALQRFVDEFKEAEGERPFNKVKGLIGSVESGVSDLGSEHRTHLLQRIKRA